MHPLKHSMQASIIDPDSIAGPVLFGREGRKKKGKILNGEFIIKQGCLGVSKPVAACSQCWKRAWMNSFDGVPFFLNAIHSAFFWGVLCLKALLFYSCWDIISFEEKKFILVCRRSEICLFRREEICRNLIVCICTAPLSWDSMVVKMWSGIHTCACIVSFYPWVSRSFLIYAG